MAREIGVNLACEATNERGQEFIVDINCPRMSDIRRPFAIDRVAREQEGGEEDGEEEKKRTFWFGLYWSRVAKAKQLEARFN